MSGPGPVRAVLQAFEAGATSLQDVERRTGLSRDLVDLAVERLVTMGRLDREELSVGCPGGGCGSCAAATPDGAPACGASKPSARRQGTVPVMLQLRRR